MVRIGLIDSEEMSFENVDADDRQWMPAYTISSPMSLRLRRAKKVKFHFHKVIFNVSESSQILP